MMFSRSSLVLLAMILTFPGSSVRAQATQSIEEARRQIEDLDIDGAIAGLKSVLAAEGRLNQQQLIRAHVLLGVAEVTRGRVPEAQSAFHEALWLDPHLTVDSLTHLSSSLADVFSSEQSRWTSTLHVTSDPPGARVLFGSRLLGQAPLERRVPAEAIVELKAIGPSGEKGIRFLLPERSAVTVHIEIPQDTLAWPAESTAAALVRRYRALPWTPSKPAPLKTNPPTYDQYKRGGAYVLKMGGYWAVAGLLTAFILDYSTTDEEGNRFVSEKAMYPVFSGIIGFFGFGFAGIYGDHKARKELAAARQRHVAESRRYQAWEERGEAQRRSWVNQRANEDLLEFRRRREAVVAENMAIRARNALIPEPSVTMERISGG